MSCKKTMLLSCVLAMLICCVVSTSVRHTARPTLYPDYQYPESYKDHVYTSLTENGQKLFFPVNIHPSCAAKKGTCIKRGLCREKKMLYISRVCYLRDLVCCYSDVIKHPEIAPNENPNKNSSDSNQPF